MKESQMKAEQLIINERLRQISKEGWTTEHDDQHIHGELEKSADCYYEYAEDNDYSDTKVPFLWPWGKDWWKPKDQLRDYIRAGALYRAEKERLERTGGAVGQKLTGLRIGIRQCEIRIDEILEHEAYCAKKHEKASPSVTINELSPHGSMAQNINGIYLTDNERNWYEKGFALAYNTFGPDSNRLSKKEGELTEENERLRAALQEIEELAFRTGVISSSIHYIKPMCDIYDLAKEALKTKP